MRELTTTEVQTMLQAGVDHGVTLNKVICVAVVDQGGNLRGALRPERGRLANMLIAEKKAWTAAAWQRTTEQVRAICLDPARPGHGLQFIDDRVCIVAGGYPLIDEAGDVIGAVGTSGGTADEDVACSLAALAAAGFKAP